MYPKTRAEKGACCVGMVAESTRTVHRPPLMSSSLSCSSFTLHFHSKLIFPSSSGNHSFFSSSPPFCSYYSIDLEMKNGAVSHPKLNLDKDIYVRNRDHPYFRGIRKGEPVIGQDSNSEFSGSDSNQNLVPPSLKPESDSNQNLAPPSSKGDDSEPSSPDVSEDASEKASKISASNILLLETYGRTSSGRHSKFIKNPSFLDVQREYDIDLNESNEFVMEPLSRDYEANEEEDTVPILPKSTVEKTYTVNKTSSDISKIPLPQSAASFYIGSSPQVEVVESCESINYLNQYLKARRDDIRAGVPGKFLHVVLGQEIMDVGSAVSTIMYAFYLSVTMKNSQLCTVPVINIKRADLNSHAEIKWLFDSCHLDQSSLIFIDEIDLFYYYAFGSLRLVLLNGHKLPFDQEALKDALVEVFNCKKGVSIYPWVPTVTTGQDCSCCALIAEKFSLVSPEILAGKDFSRLMLAAILLETGNLKIPQCTSKDKYMSTLMINGAGRFGCNGLYQILKYKMYDISELKVGDILRKDFKKWTRVGSRMAVSHIGMSSIGISVRQLLTHEDSATHEIVSFQQSEKLRLLMIVSGYYDSRKSFKREILVSAESVELMKNLLHFFNANASQLPLKALYQPGLRDELKAFEIDNKVTSRKTIERLLEEFGGAARQQSVP